MVNNLGLNHVTKHLKLQLTCNLDLVLVAPHAKPPVARIMDYGKFKFEQQKKDKETRKNQKIINDERSSFEPNN